MRRITVQKSFGRHDKTPQGFKVFIKAIIIMSRMERWAEAALIIGELARGPARKQSTSTSARSFGYGRLF